MEHYRKAADLQTTEATEAAFVRLGKGDYRVSARD